MALSAAAVENTVVELWISSAFEDAGVVGSALVWASEVIGPVSTPRVALGGLL
jgi:hypothetical protein